MITASQLRAGLAVRINGEIYKVLEVEVKAGGGQLGGVVKSKLRSVTSGRMWEPHFRPDERLDDLELERQSMEFLYSDNENCVFMNPITFEQVEVPRASVGTAEKFLQPAMRVPVELFAGRPVSIVLPDVAELRVADTAPAMHAQQDSTLKEATLENGVKIRVPLFVATGEVIRVDVRSGKYLERVREKKKSA